MPSIHVITDRERLKRIFSTLANEDLSVRISGGLDAGLPELQHEVPEALFIQSHLNGLTGELIVRHVTTYATPATKIILLREGQETCRGISLAIDLGLSDEELLAAIQEAIDRFAHGKVKKTVRRKTALDVEEPEEETASEPEASSAVVPAVDNEEKSFQNKLQTFITEMNGPAIDAPPKPAATTPVRNEHKVPVKVVAGASVGFLIAIAGALTIGNSGDDTKINKHVPPAVAKVEKQTLKNPEVPAQEKGKPAPLAATSQPAPQIPAATGEAAPVPPSTAAVKPAPPAQTSAAQPSAKPASPAAAPSQVGAKAPATPSPTQPAGQQPPKPPVPQGASPTGPRTTIPGFVPREKMDKAYAAKHPGWERYLGKNTEFRVYRPGGVVKAVQAIDRKGVGIPKDFLDYALKQMVGSPQLAIQGTEKKGEYDVTRAAAAEGSRVLLYRKGEKKPLKAFVVYFDETGTTKR